VTSGNLTPKVSLQFTDSGIQPYKLVRRPSSVVINLLSWTIQ